MAEKSKAEKELADELASVKADLAVKEQTIEQLKSAQEKVKDTGGEFRQEFKAVEGAGVLVTTVLGDCVSVCFISGVKFKDGEVVSQNAV